MDAVGGDHAHQSGTEVVVDVAQRQPRGVQAETEERP